MSLTRQKIYKIFETIDNDNNIKLLLELIDILKKNTTINSMSNDSIFYFTERLKFHYINKEISGDRIENKQYSNNKIKNIIIKFYFNKWIINNETLKEICAYPVLISIVVNKYNYVRMKRLINYCYNNNYEYFIFIYYKYTIDYYYNETLHNTNACSSYQEQVVECLYSCAKNTIKGDGIDLLTLNMCKKLLIFIYKYGKGGVDKNGNTIFHILFNLNTKQEWLKWSKSTEFINILSIITGINYYKPDEKSVIFKVMNYFYDHTYNSIIDSIPNNLITYENKYGETIKNIIDQYYV